MPTFKGKDGKKAYHPNPQMGKALYSGSPAGKVSNEESKEEKISPGIHEKVAAVGGAHHVEIHRGPHEHGTPPPHEGHTHHVIVHHHSASGGLGGSKPPAEHGDQLQDETASEIHNHEGYDSAEADARASMGEEHSSPMGMAGEDEYGSTGDEVA